MELLSIFSEQLVTTLVGAPLPELEISVNNAQSIRLRIARLAWPF